MDVLDAFKSLEDEIGLRYGVDVYDFLAACSDGLALEMFPGCEDLLDIVEALEELPW